MSSDHDQVKASRIKPKPFKCVACRGEGSRLIYVKDERTYVRCRACHLVQVTPMPTKAECLEFYEDTDHYSVQVERVQDESLERERGVIRELVALGAEGPFLDVGAGSGLLVRAAEEQGWDCVALELSRPNVDKIRARSSANVHLGSLDDFESPSGRFKVIAFSHCLEHVPDPVETLSRAFDLLAPGGMLYIAVPNFASSKRWLGAGRHVSWIYEHHLTYFEAKTLASLLNRVGFDVATQRSLNYAGDYRFVLGMLRRWGLDRRARRFLHLGERPLVSLLADDIQLRCPAWRTRFFSAFVHGILRFWPDRLSERAGWGDEIRVMARRTSSSPRPSARTLETSSP